MVIQMKHIEDLLTLHEGLRLHAYDDATGKSLKRGDTLTGNLTIGIGRNLSSNGLTKREVTSLLRNDIQTARKKARRYKWFDALNEVRQGVVLSLIFNMGSIDSFKRMRAAISVKDYELASIELLDSRYAEQVGDRAIVLAGYLRTGSWD
jgi:lysozyme